MRLISSLAAAAAILADQAADRLDTWVEHHATGAEAPRETPLGFTVPTDVTVKGLAGEQRARWLAEVKARVDASTGGPWCTEERENPTGRIISPYGVIATSVTREADRDLIEEARADLFGLLALAKYDDQVIEALQYATRHQTERRNVAERELAGMHEREGAVDRVLDSLVDGRLKLAEYIDHETPAGRVKELLTTLLHQVRDAQSGDQVQHLTDALQAAEERAAVAERKLDAHHRHDDATEHTDGPFLSATDARAEAHLIKVALDHLDRGHDPRATLHFQGRPLATRVVDTIGAARCDHDAHTDADAVRARAAERILAFAAEELPKVNDTYGTVYISGLETAAALITDAPGTNPPAIVVPVAGFVRDAIDAALTLGDDGTPEGILTPGNNASVEDRLTQFMAIQSLLIKHGINEDPGTQTWHIVGEVLEARKHDRTEAIAEFVSHQSAHYRKHSAEAIKEDIKLAVAMGVPLEHFYDPEDVAHVQAQFEAEAADEQLDTAIDEHHVGIQVKHPSQLDHTEDGTDG